MREPKIPQKDEHYVTDLCDQIVGAKAERQYRGFAFLTGDTGRRLPVDAFYPGLNLVIEYHERQHTEAVLFFDKPSRLTCSGIPRSKQRALYDKRRRERLPRHGMKLVILDYRMFQHDSAERLIRVPSDVAVIRAELRRQASFRYTKGR